MKQDQFELTSYKTSRIFSILILILTIVIYVWAVFEDANVLFYISYFLMFALLLNVIDAFDKSPILIVDKNGICGKMINKKISWRLVSSYNTTNLTNVDTQDSFRVDFYLKDNERIRITWWAADQSFDDVRRAILKYSSEYDIIDKGHHQNDQPLQPWLPSSS
ncbi:hypothetical protein [Cytophaga aurantiaca]|uniref:hypothetical protein n=1 Tax=Cytophaga aurantiaca TaxID=29530 RepID=UPI00036BBB9D|nr:hypothetical protein [Cytophaga aurantiaca]